MKFVSVNTIKSNFRIAADLVVIPVTKKHLKDINSVDARLKRLLKATLGAKWLEVLKFSNFKASFKEMSEFSANSCPGQKLILVGFDAETSKLTSDLSVSHNYRILGGAIASKALALKAKTVAISTLGDGFDQDLNLEALIEGLELGLYRFNKYSKKSQDNVALKKVEFLFASNSFKRALKTATAISEAVYVARDLINTPPNFCSPDDLVKRAKLVAKSSGLAIKIFDRKQLTKMGAGGILAVAAGSVLPPYLIELKYSPKKVGASRRIGLVGKGVTFDSGGLSLKPGPSMYDMKMDMSGAAAVLGTMQAISQLKPEVQVNAYIPIAENMISGSAVRPGDVITAMNGKTIEVLNTDAEGRLIMADALCLAEREGCETIIDIATLTGACMVALGLGIAGVFSKDADLTKELIEAGRNAGERLWAMPLAEDYAEELKSNVSDLKNIGGSYGGAIHAALFLKEFVAKARWAHVDIAGPAYVQSAKDHLTKGGVGFGVGTLTRFLCAVGEPSIRA